MSKKNIIILSVAIVVVMAGVFYYIGNDIETPIQDQEQDFDDEEEITEEEEPDAQEPEVKEDTSFPKNTLSDLGDFKIVYGQTQESRYAEMNELIKNSHIFENVADFLNQILILQKDFPIVFQQCGFVNAYYTYQEKEIVICDELLENFAQNFVYYVNTEEELDKAVTDAAYFIFFHELGHGLIDTYNLVYSGKEEDVVDQLASVVLIGLGEDGVRAAITGANFFYITSSEIGPGYPFWDEHALNQQRYYNILCWVYGSNPQKYNDFVGVYGLPQERAVWCEREYQKMSDFWDAAIYPFLQEQIKEQMDK